MKNFIMLAALIVTSSEAFACTNVKLKYKNEVLTICKFKDGSYLSKNCRDPGRCFFDGKVKIDLDPSQSPGFTLCYAIKGEPFFGEIVGEKDKVPLCKKGAFIADQDKIFYHYKSLKQ